jgi:pimeloyl-ACP methyl ester carboxylesterase
MSKYGKVSEMESNSAEENEVATAMILKYGKWLLHLTILGLLIAVTVQVYKIPSNQTQLLDNTQQIQSVESNIIHLLTGTELAAYIPPVIYSKYFDGTVNNGNMKLHYIESGDPTAPLMILVHSYFWNLHDWDFMLPTLTQNYHVIAYDLRGYGLSDAPDSEIESSLRSITVDNSVRDLRELINYLYTVNPTANMQPICVGHSLGATICQEYAIQYTNNSDSLSLSKLILISGSPQFQASPSFNSMSIINDTNWPYGVPDTTFAYLSSIIQSNFSTFVGLLAQTVLSDVCSNDNLFDNNIGAILANIANPTTTPLIQYDYFNLLRHASTTNSLGTITVPVLIIGGTNDQLVPPKAHSFMSLKIHDSDFHQIEGGGHLLPSSHPRYVLQLISKFLNAPVCSQFVY